MIKRKGKNCGPKACGDLFKRGYWVGMIAEQLGISDTSVEAKLMKRIRDLERQVKIAGARP